VLVTAELKLLNKGNLGNELLFLKRIKGIIGLGIIEDEINE